MKELDCQLLSQIGKKAIFIQEEERIALAELRRV
jgi:hypothetical protein